MTSLMKRKHGHFLFKVISSWHSYDFSWSSESQTLMCMRTTYGLSLLTRSKVGEEDFLFRSCWCCWSDHCTVRNVFCPWPSKHRNTESFSRVINQSVHSGSSFPRGSPSLLWCMWKNHSKKETSLILPVNFCFTLSSVESRHLIPRVYGAIPRWCESQRRHTVELQETTSPHHRRTRACPS